MYSTCLFCNAPFEKNESLEAFPVGRRLAFDEAKGRLWVVCKKCERWSLSPLDERWEAIEQAERLFRDTRKRVSTDNIGLAKVSEGTTLIRIGAPQRPEFAAWRYGDQFGRRRKRRMLYAGAGLAAVGAAVAGAIVAGAGIISLAQLLAHGGRVAIYGRPNTIVARTRDANGGLVEIRRRHVGEAAMSRSSAGTLELKVTCRNNAKKLFRGEVDTTKSFEGPEAHRVAGILIPKLNRFGGNQREVSGAVGKIEAAGSPDEFVAQMSRAGRFSSLRRLADLNETQRLALEMALHEEAERRALEGELAELELAWRDAEEIAAIADNLTLPDSVNTALEKLKNPKT